MTQKIDHFPGTNRLQATSNLFIYSEPSKSEVVLHHFSPQILMCLN